MKIISLDELEKVPIDMAGAKNLFKQVPYIRQRRISNVLFSCLYS